jgi:hypothetical protein
LIRTTREASGELHTYRSHKQLIALLQHSREELRHGLSAKYHLNFTEVNFDKVMRVVDPDQGGAITHEEFQLIVLGPDAKRERPYNNIERATQLHSI